MKKLFINSYLIIFFISFINIQALADIDNNADWEQPTSIFTINEKEDWQDLEDKFGIPAKLLQRYNNLKPNSTMAIGEKLLIPAKIIYQIEKGETAIQIANEYGMTFSELITLNNIIDPDALKSGYKLKIIEMDIKIKLSWPTNGEIISNFGIQQNGVYSNDIRIITKADSEIKAAAPGIIVYAGNEIGNYGNLIIIRHKDDWFSSYGHLNTIMVQKGSIVEDKQILGSIKTNDPLLKPELYFGLRNGTKAVDPLKYLEPNKKRTI